MTLPPESGVMLLSNPRAAVATVGLLFCAYAGWRILQTWKLRDRPNPTIWWISLVLIGGTCIGLLGRWSRIPILAILLAVVFLLVRPLTPLTCDYQLVESFNHRAELQRDFAALKIPDMWALLPEMTLYGDSMRRALDDLAGSNSMSLGTVSTDLFPRLEYGSPKGLTLSYDTSSANYEFLTGFQKDYRSQIVTNGILDAR